MKNNENIIFYLNKAKKQNKKEKDRDYYMYLISLKDKIKQTLKEGKLKFNNDGLYHCGLHDPIMFPRHDVGICIYYDITKIGLLKLNIKIKMLERKYKNEFNK